MYQRAFTLIELMIALAVGGILLYFAVPPFEAMLERIETTSRVNGLIGMIPFARQTAVTEGRWVTVCPADAFACSNRGTWHTGIMAFVDVNRDGERQPAERMVAYFDEFKSGESLFWRSFRRRNYLQFRPAGYTNWQNGSFHYCPASRDPQFGKVVIVNIQGRVVPSLDTDGDGIDEQANGNPLAC
jgi:prepilin-type N-terminal cleavage/methylation domain-containing protein